MAMVCCGPRVYSRSLARALAVIAGFFERTPVLYAQNPGATLSDPTDGGRMGWRETQYPAWGQGDYYDQLKLNYRYRNVNIGNEVKNIFYVTELRVDPCRLFLRTGAKGDMCCRDMNHFGCQDHPDDIVGGADLQVAYFQNAHIPSCAGTTFEKDPNCGSTLEIHRKDRASPVIVDVRIDNDMPSGFQTTYLPTYMNGKSLCVGDYEVWFVVRTRAGPFVEARKDFRVRSPTCREPTQDDIQAVEEEVGDAVGVIIGGRSLEGSDNGKNQTAPGRTQASSRTASRALIEEANRRARENRAQGGVQGSPEWKERLRKMQEKENLNRRNLLPSDQKLRDEADERKRRYEERQRRLGEIDVGDDSSEEDDFL